MREIAIRTTRRTQLVEITEDVQSAVNGANGAAAVLIYVPHTTAGVTVNGTVTALNGSFAAEDLGILGSTASATLTGEDRATVAVDSAFSHLISLRDALLSNDERGISLATGAMEADLNRLASARADVGVRTQRVADAVTREEDLKLQETGLKSSIQDLDYTEASVRFAQLQQQLQAGLLTASRAQSLSLLDFLR